MSTFIARLRLLAAASAAVLLSHCPLLAADAPDAIVKPTPADQALAARAEAVWETAAGTPGKEAANFLHKGWMHDNVRRLAGQLPSTAGQLAWARETVGQRVDEAEKGPKWVIPSVAKVPRANKALKLSGQLDDPAWAGALRYDGLYKLDFTQRSEHPRTSWRLLWDDTYIYLGVDCEDSDVRAPELPVNSNLWEHDCIEVFLLPDPAKADYWEIVVSPSGSRFQALHHKLADEWGATGPNLPEVPGMKVATHIRTQPAGYSIEFAIPFAALPGYAGRAPATGQKLWLQLARMDAHPDAAHKDKDRVDMYNFIPTLSWNHNIWNYAPIELAEQKDIAAAGDGAPVKVYTDAVITPAGTTPPAPPTTPAAGGTAPAVPTPAK